MSKEQKPVTDTDNSEADDVFEALFPNLFQFVSLVRADPEIDLSKAYPSLSKGDLAKLLSRLKTGETRPTDFLAVFQKGRKCLTGFARQCHGKKLIHLSIHDLAKGKKRLNEKLLNYLSSHYQNKGTLSGQKSLINRLIAAELVLMVRGPRVDPRAAALGVLDVNSLRPHLKRLWELMPREGGRNTGVDTVKRLALPLTDLGGKLLAVLQEVNRRFDIDDAETLLISHHRDIADGISSNDIEHKDRAYALEILANCRKAFGLKLPAGTRALSVDRLPKKLRLQLDIFNERAPRGLGAFDDLRVLAVQYKCKTGPFSDGTVRGYNRALLIGLSRIDLDESMGVEDLLLLVSRSIESQGKVVGEELFNPHFKKYQDEEREKVKPGIKEADFDTVMVSHFAEAVCSVARFNGEFYLPHRFRQYIKIRIDYDSRRDRKHLKKQTLTIEWIDREILKLKVRFDRVVREKTFFHNKKDLQVCVFLVQLVVLRYLGFRQQCLRRCVIGKNISFNSDGTITFHYNRNEIKNKVMIHETLSRELHGDFDEIMLLMDVLEKYYQRILRPIRTAFPELYMTHVGDAFFVSTPGSSEKGLIQRYPVEKEGDSRDKRARTNTRSAGRLRTWFETAAYAHMAFGPFKALKSHFNPHYLRAICCDWMKKVLGWSWEEISKAMGDSERTLRQDYFDAGARIQDATDFFTRTSRERKAERAERGKEGAHVPVNLFNTLQKNLELNTKYLEEQTSLRVAAEEKVATLEGYVDYLLPRCNLSMRELTTLVNSATGQLAKTA